MIITITLNPAIDKTAVLPDIRVYGLNRLQNVTRDAGGKGINVSKTIQKLGGYSTAMGFLGGSTGQFIKEALTQLHVDHQMLDIDGLTRENLKIVDEDGNLTEFNESGPILTNKDINKLIHKVIDVAKKNDIIVLSGSIPPSLPKDTYASMVRDFKNHGLRVILDADGETFAHALKEGPTVIKPNAFELANYFNVDEDMDEASIISYARQLLEFGSQLVVISMGKDGALFVNSTQVIKTKGLKVAVKSTVGAGDAMVAAIAYAMEEKLSLQALIRLAVATSAGAVMSEGTKPAEYEVIESLMKQVMIEQLEVKK